MAKRVKKTKGIFGITRLPVAGSYLVPRRRRREWLIGALLCIATAAVLGLGYASRGARIVAPAPVSSAHATFESSCGSCHQPFGGAADHKCLDCHERQGEVGYFGLAAHADRFGGGAGEAAAPGCADCHSEHRGRLSTITFAADAACADCHVASAFDSSHQDFEFAREDQSDDSNLNFSHRLHVARVASQKAYEDPQRSCLYCHQPQADGAGFEPLDFRRQCGECHLAAGTATDWMPVGSPANPQRLGALDLEAIRAASHPGTRWAFFQNPRELRRRGQKIAKEPVYHADPWVLENLRRIREVLYPDAGLAMLLAAVPAQSGGQEATPEKSTGELTAEVIGTLRERVRELRHRPEHAVQKDLDTIEALLEAADSKLAAGDALTLGSLALPAAPDPSLEQEHLLALRSLVHALTGPCRQCHVVTNGAISNVQEDQKILRRARFDHRAHVLLVPHCVDCHSAIPSMLAGAGTLETPVPLDAADLATTQNVPGIAVCRQCHAPALADSTCVSCHTYHPGDGRHRADLRPWLVSSTNQYRSGTP